jgi:hypothetical protein
MGDGQIYFELFHNVNKVSKIFTNGVLKSGIFYRGVPTLYQ